MKSNANNIIKFEGDNNALFVKKQTSGLAPDTKLIVPDTHNAILLKDGQMMDTLNSGSHEIFDKKKKKVTQAVLVEVIFMSKTAKLRVCWGTKTQFSFRDFDTDVAIKVGAHGEFEVQICNPRKFYLELVGADKEYDVEKLKDRLAMRLMSKVEPAIARTMREQNLTYDHMAEHKDIIATGVHPILSSMFEEDYGLKMFSFTLGKVMIADEYIQTIEQVRKEKKVKAEEEDRKEKEKKEATAEDDKNWEREKWLLELQQTDYNKYLEVCKAIGWEPKSGGKNGGAGRFCPNCGHSYNSNDKFCPGCGKKVGDYKKTCHKCGRECTSDVNFCSGCGAKLD